MSLCLILDESADEVETIHSMVKACDVEGPIFIKYCDSSFTCPITKGNGIAYMQITGDIQSISDPADKSYITIDDMGRVSNIAEKAILGDNVCVGAYSFNCAERFIEVARDCRDWMQETAFAEIELAISDVIWGYMTREDGHLLDIDWFTPIPASDYNDWETLSAWKSYVCTFSTLFIDIDGILFKSSERYIAPKWGSRLSLPENVAYLKSLRSQGRTQIILTTSRPESFRAEMELQLELWEIPYDQLVMSILEAQRIMVNDYSKSNPFPSA